MKKSVRNKKIKDLPYYWICAPCAKAKGGVFPKVHNCTAMNGTCKYCDEDEVTLIPWVDFNWPEDPERSRLAKINRD
jgi:hypothetical protein